MTSCNPNPDAEESAASDIYSTGTYIMERSQLSGPSRYVLLPRDMLLATGSVHTVNVKRQLLQDHHFYQPVNQTQLPAHSTWFLQPDVVFMTVTGLPHFQWTLALFLSPQWHQLPWNFTVLLTKFSELEAHLNTTLEATLLDRPIKEKLVASLLQSGAGEASISCLCAATEAAAAAAGRTNLTSCCWIKQMALRLPFTIHTHYQFW